MSLWSVDLLAINQDFLVLKGFEISWTCSRLAPVWNIDMPEKIFVYVFEQILLEML